jgi:hypothetical protein
LRGRPHSFASEAGRFVAKYDVENLEAGIIALNMHYDSFALLDGPPPVAKTLGPRAHSGVPHEGRGPDHAARQSILRRVTDLSF